MGAQEAQAICFARAPSANGQIYDHQQGTANSSYDIYGYNYNGNMTAFFGAISNPSRVRKTVMYLKYGF